MWDTAELVVLPAIMQRELAGGSHGYGHVHEDDTVTAL